MCVWREEKKDEEGIGRSGEPRWCGLCGTNGIADRIEEEMKSIYGNNRNARRQR
jgi:hypothetical protein